MNNYCISIKSYSSVAVLNLWVMTVRGLDDPFSGSPKTILHSRYLQFTTVAKLQLCSNNKNPFMVEGPSMRRCTKGRRMRRVEGRCSNAKCGHSHCNPSTGQPEAGGLPQGQGQPGLENESLSPTTKSVL